MTMAERIQEVDTKLEEHCKSQVISESVNRDEHKTILAEVKDTNKKIDDLPEKVSKMIENKADKSDVVDAKSNIKEIRGWLWGLVVGFLMLAISLIYQIYSSKR